MNAETGENKPVDIGSRLELFVDRYLIENMAGLELRLGEPRQQPLARSPIKDAHYMTVIKDGGLYRAYYRGVDPGYKGDAKYSGHPGEVTCYAESGDGVEWTFPDLGLFEVNGTRKNNVVLAEAPFSHNFSPFLDSRPGTPAEERFKAVAGLIGYKRDFKNVDLHAFVSPDGIHWKRITRKPFIAFRSEWYHAFDSQNVAFWSGAEGKYVCYFRTYETPHGRLRAIFRSDSLDFKNWSEPVDTGSALPGEHLYTNQTHPYFRAPHMYIALPSRFVAGRIGAEDAPRHLGTTDILFMSWRAGASAFERLFTEAFIRPGLDPERWANRGNYVALNVVPTGPAEMSIYHCKSGHRYTLRTDGFVSVRAGAEEGRLLTRPFVFKGGELVVNYSTSAAGGLRVEIQDESGKPVPGFGLEDSCCLVGDEIERVVKWSGEPDSGVLAGKPVRLMFVMQEADLYSFRFKERLSNDLWRNS